jgi:hypothetical protein
VSAEPAAPAEETAGDPLMHDVRRWTQTLTHTNEAAHDPKQILSDGIRDVTETLVPIRFERRVADGAETMYRGMGLPHAHFIRDTKLGTMRARLGFGTNIERTIPKCTFPLAFSPDVFHVALDKGVDIVIEDALAPKIVSRIPLWHQQAMPAKSFLLLPVMVKNQAIGLFYADSEQAEGIKVTPQQLGLLRTLRSQVVLAFKQKM